MPVFEMIRGTGKHFQKQKVRGPNGEVLKNKDGTDREVLYRYDSDDPRWNKVESDAPLDELFFGKFRRLGAPESMSKPQAPGGDPYARPAGPQELLPGSQSQQNPVGPKTEADFRELFGRMSVPELNNTVKDMQLDAKGCNTKEKLVNLLVTASMQEDEE